MNIRIATRKSPLALWQAEHVRQLLLQKNPGVSVSFVKLSTQGDRNQTTALTELGGKSLFVKELQLALLNGEADLAVHSIKDMSALDHPDLTLAAVCERGDSRDAFVSLQYKALDQLPANAVIGTSSPRRAALLKSQHPSLHIQPLRGNIGTRLEKLKNGTYDGIILAAAGLHRLKLSHLISAYLDPNCYIPAIGQGAIGIECIKETPLIKHTQLLNHTNTAECVLAERTVNRILGGNCHTPLAAYATIHQQQMTLRAFVSSPDGKTQLQSQQSGTHTAASEIGERAAKDLLSQGAYKLLNAT